MIGANYKCNACGEETTGFNHETGFETQSALRLSDIQGYSK
jgi:hypothetical protein